MALTLGPYSTGECDRDTCNNVDTNLDEKAFREWLYLGVRGESGEF